jgi:hypothetical protein
VSVYNAGGYFEKNELDAYSLNNVTAKKGDDGSMTIQFGGCNGKLPNCLPITQGWNYWMRLCRTHAEILDGTWKFSGSAAGTVRTLLASPAGSSPASALWQYPSAGNHSPDCNLIGNYPICRKPHS